MFNQSTNLFITTNFDSSDNKRISNWSSFYDSKWIFADNISISWVSPPERFKNINSEDFQQMMKAVKQLAYIEITTKTKKNRTICRVVSEIKEFAGWLLSRPVPIKKFSDANKIILQEYKEAAHLFFPVKRKKQQSFKEKISSDAVYIKLNSISKLYDYKNDISDAIQELPGLFLESGEFQPRQLKTTPFTIEELKEILTVAVTYLENNAEVILQEFNKFVKDENLKKFHKVIICGLHSSDFNEQISLRLRNYLSESRDPSLRFSSTYLYLKYIAAKLKLSFEDTVTHILNDEVNNRSFKIKRATLKINVGWKKLDLGKKINLLQTSCFIIIAISTGMRLSELLAIEPGCLIEKNYEGRDVFWVKSKLMKTSSNSKGEEAYWICGELAARAVTLLERLHSLTTLTMTAKKTKLEIGNSLFRSYIWNGLFLEARKSSMAGLYKFLVALQKQFNLDVGNIHPHRFRASFAKAIVHLTNTSILSLQRHFKHVSLFMTDCYVGTDHELLTSYFKELKALSAVKMRQILKGECAGPGGLLSNRNLKIMFEEENLAAGYSGDIKSNLDEIIDEIQDIGVVAHKCGEFTTCVYVPEQAKCGDEGPQAHKCHPTTCPNSFILLEDVPFYLKNIKQNLAIYESLSDFERQGPYGITLEKSITRDKKAIQPLAVKYMEKLNDTKEKYKLMSETKRNEAKAMSLKYQIDCEFDLMLSLKLEYESKKHRTASSNIKTGTVRENPS